MAIAVGASAGPKRGVIFHGTPFLLGKCYGVLYGRLDTMSLGVPENPADSITHLGGIKQ